MPFILDFNESLRFHRWSVLSSSIIKKTFLVNNLLTVSGYIQNVGKHQFGTVLDTSSLNILCYNVLSEISAELDQDFFFSAQGTSCTKMQTSALHHQTPFSI